MKGFLPARDPKIYFFKSFFVMKCVFHATILCDLENKHTLLKQIILGPSLRLDNHTVRQ